VTDGIFLWFFFTFYDFLSVKTCFKQKKFFKIFGVKPILSLIYFIYAESKNEFRAKKSFPSVTRRCLPFVGRNLYRRYLSRLEGYRFEISAILRQLGWIEAPHTLNFEILKSLEQTQESKKFKITFEIFVKMLDGFNFGKRCLLQCSCRILFQNWKILKFS
jgi:hypothetical protein